MSQPAKVQEPSMEEILASIRRIIADDENKPIAEIAAQAQAAAAAQLGAGRREPSERTSGIAANSDASRDVPRSEPRDISQAEISTPPVTALNGFAGAHAAKEPVVHGPAADDDVLQLTDDMALPEPALSGFRKVEPANDLEFAESWSAPPSAAQPGKPRGAASAKPTTGPEVMSRATFSAVESAFNSLAATVLSNNSRTLEDLVKEMLRPMLKNWLDDNLPSLVERLVRTEIERVSRGR